MNRTGVRNRVLLLASIFAAGGILLVAGLLPLKCDCYVKCSPVIAVTNYPYFSALLRNLIEDRLITELKLCLSEKLSLALLPGSLGVLETGLRKATDLSSLVEDTVSDGLGSQLAFVKTRMNVEAFASRLNKAVLSALSKELKRLELEDSRIRGVLSDYQREFLNSRRALATYADEAGDFQARTADFLPVSAKLLSRVTVLGGKMDVADGIQGKQGAEVSGNTRQMIDEIGTHTKGGLKNIARIAEISLADSISRGFCSASGAYLAARLEKLRGLKNKAAVSSQDLGKIIESVDKAAMGVPSEYIRTSAAELADMAKGMRTSVNRKMKDGIAAAILAVNSAMSSEKEKERAIDRLYSAIEREAERLLGDAVFLAAVAREKGGVSFLDREGVRKIAVLLAGRNSSKLRRRLAVRHYIVARTSLEMAAAIRSGLSGFDPAAIDRGYEDMAWKDLARFNYYLLNMENQRLKLLALRAMAEALATEDPDVSRYAEDRGLPEGFQKGMVR
ncbi:MAG: hypothetical protein A4E60_00017 [Syntrophorhabdus sp. PtaB.Bin047]|nr:MAG: hypothetical protein A4E60_00017 [Syntrophorhabdus sp. PtaB.Bin047]